MNTMINTVRGCLPGKIFGMSTLLLLMLWAGVAQAFLMENLDEERVDLQDYLGDGRWTVVMFWATDCIPCEEQKPAFEAFHQRHKDIDASVLGIAIDGLGNKSEVNRLIELHQPTYPNLVAFSDVFHRQYQELVGKPFRVTPTYLVFGPQGDLQGSVFGDMDFDALSQFVSAPN